MIVDWNNLHGSKHNLSSHNFKTSIKTKGQKNTSTRIEWIDTSEATATTKKRRGNWNAVILLSLSLCLFFAVFALLYFHADRTWNRWVVVNKNFQVRSNPATFFAGTMMKEGMECKSYGNHTHYSNYKLLISHVTGNFLCSIQQQTICLCTIEIWAK